MEKKPINNFMFMALVMSTLMSITTTNWLYMWMFIEVNMFSFLTFIMNPSSNLKTEAAIKYFLVQSITSSVMMSVAMMMMMKTYAYMKLLMMMAIATKAGLAPMHQWMISVAKSLTSNTFIMMMTWQKILPWSLVMLYLNNKSVFLTLAIMNALTGGLGGLTQTLLRPLLVYSSINHTSWILIAMSHSMTLFIIYMVVYFIMLTMLMKTFTSAIPTNQWHLSSTLENKITSSGMKTINFLSMAGMPPTLGFAIKWMVMNMVWPNIMVMSCLLMMSMVTLMYYTKISLTNSVHTKKSKYMKSNTNNKITMIIHLATPMVFIVFT